jgi:hypothetical protein
MKWLHPRRRSQKDRECERGHASDAQAAGANKKTGLNPLFIRQGYVTDRRNI